MPTLVLLALAGFGAQLVDGALGMGYGVTSTTLLLIAGLGPAAASASVHLAKIGTALASGYAHWRFGNVDWKLVGRLGVPGAIGALLGALLLSHLSAQAAAPLMAGLLIVIGAFILIKYAVAAPPEATARTSPHGRRFLTPLGFVGGFVDATGGGGWGPVSTASLLTAGRTAPRTVIGSVSTSEFLVTVAASLGFVIGLGGAGIDWLAVAGLVVGGMLAAPLAAWLVTKLPAAVLGAAVGGLIVLTNARTMFAAVGVAGSPRIAAYVVIAVVWLVLVGMAVRRVRVARRSAPAEEPAVEEQRAA
ncbi:sulfite exporter TauE/SafE family protein [Pseudonocardia bannensis]|uniref:Probable membrane transporter protein n=1 Tax=Pseudonocardia bannensis TaxID=630973 RepID=A0A848DRL2_9PSEU|nr:sulfite exporter TauE/SafE family protein [Pseudonocardia bannensis]NMH95378.1 sulfite exporter TauE/SafE family protein [Pseudonocardia bannensis]